MDWFLMKESSGVTFFEPFESREKAIADAEKWGAEVIRQATIIETSHLQEDWKLEENNND